MILGIFHNGSGVGNQLHRYVATRCLALDKGYDFGMFHDWEFKGSSFLKINTGGAITEEHTTFPLFEEKRINNDEGVDIRVYDEEFVKNLPNNVVIDGEFQDERYWQKHKKEVASWLKTEKVEMPDDVCVINFRGGEYVGIPELFLPKDYWDTAIAMMIEKYPTIRFEVHTDDALTAGAFFEGYPIITGLQKNWQAIRYAKHLILSNSSFAILPAWLNENAKEVIAPKYWARYNKKFWALPQNEYKKFIYIHHEMDPIAL